MAILLRTGIGGSFDIGIVGVTLKIFKRLGILDVESDFVLKKMRYISAEC